MADKRIQDFETLEEAQDEDLILISSNEDTYNMTVRTLNDKLIDETETDLDPRFQTIEAKLANTTIDPDDLGLYKDRDTGYIYPTYQGEASKNGLKLSLSTDDSTILSVVNTAGWQSKSVVSGGTCTLSINWSSLKNNKSTGKGTLTVTVGNVAQTAKSVAQGDVSIDVASYLKAGINRVKLTITDASSNTSTVSYTVTLVELTIATTFDEKAVIATGETFDYAYSVTGELSKTVYFLVDDKQVATAVIESSGRWHRQTIPALEVGSHTLKVYCTATVDGTTITSNTLTHALTIAESDVTSYVAELAEQAATSASNAATSEKNAKSSETAAKSSQTAAASSASAAKSSQTAAKTSETNAKTSETNAKSSQTATKTSETNAKTSETNAKTSEANAADSATLSESWAVGGTGTRTGEDTNNAKYYSEQASASKTAAASSASTASSRASAASTSATKAANSATAAATSATNAANSATAAAASAKEAGAYTSDFTGASSSTAGVRGLVPAPAAGKQASYLRGDGTWATPTNTTYSAATTSEDGLMSASDKSKLDGIEAGATAVNSIAPLKVDTPASSAEKNGVAIGDGAVSGIQYAVAIGNKASAPGNGGIAIGLNASATGIAAAALGTDTVSSAVASTAIGHMARATGNGALAAGWYARANDDSSVAIGMNSATSDINEVSVGCDADTEVHAVTRRITHVTDPVNDSDAATKGYVDNKTVVKVKDFGGLDSTSYTPILRAREKEINNTAIDLYITAAYGGVSGILSLYMRTTVSESTTKYINVHSYYLPIRQTSNSPSFYYIINSEGYAEVWMSVNPYGRYAVKIIAFCNAGNAKEPSLLEVVANNGQAVSTAPKSLYSTSYLSTK